MVDNTLCFFSLLKVVCLPTIASITSLVDSCLIGIKPHLLIYLMTTDNNYRKQTTRNEISYLAMVKVSWISLLSFGLGELD